LKVERAARSALECLDEKSGDRFGILVFTVLEFLPPYRLFFPLFPLSNPLGLQQVQRQGKPHVGPFAAKPAANWKLQ
jgi:hypothetical protein